MSERPRQSGTDRTANEPIEREHTDQGFTTNVGFPNPGSPTEEQGYDPLPGSGGVGGTDPMAGDDLAGRDQVDTATDPRGVTPDTTTGERSGGSSTAW